MDVESITIIPRHLSRHLFFLPLPPSGIYSHFLPLPLAMRGVQRHNSRGQALHISPLCVPLLFLGSTVSIVFPTSGGDEKGEIRVAAMDKTKRGSSDQVSDDFVPINKKSPQCNTVRSYIQHSGSPCWYGASGCRAEFGKLQQWQ